MSKETKALAKRPALTEEHICTHTIGALQPMSSRILIVDYDPRWPELFRCSDCTRRLLRHALLHREGPGQIEGLLRPKRILIEVGPVYLSWLKRDRFVGSRTAAAEQQKRCCDAQAVHLGVCLPIGALSALARAIIADVRSLKLPCRI